MTVSTNSTGSRQTFFILGHIIYFSAIVLLNNSLFFIETQVRFALFGACLLIGSSLILFLGNDQRKTPNVRYIILLALFVVAAFRINVVNSTEFISIFTQYVQIILTIFTILCSYLISKKVDIAVAKNVIMASGVISFLPIFVNRYDIFNYELKDSFMMGVLTYDSYQVVSQIIGIMVICVVSFVFDRKRLDVVTIPFVMLIIAGLYTMTLSPARGEFVALILAVSTYFLTGGRWFLIAIIAIIFINFGGLIADSVVLERLSLLEYGDYGERDYLFVLALNQVFANASVLLFGGGLNYFQYYNLLPFELYPHNFILEGFVSGGFSLFLMLLIVFVIPIATVIFRANEVPHSRFLLCFMIYLVVIYMKSGTINSMWGLAIYTCFFVAAVSKQLGNVPDTGLPSVRAND